MNRALEDLSKSDLISLLKEKEKSVSNLQQRLLKKDQIIAQFQRMLFGQKRERFEGDPAQGALPFEATGQQKQEQETLYEKAISYVRKRKSNPNHKGRLPLPDHLPVEEIQIHPEGDLSEMVCIGKQVTEELELEPARFYIKRYIRYKYAPKDQNTDGVRIGELPERVIDKGIPGPGLLATILVDKYVDHLPLYRQRQRFLREGIPIASSTLDGWAAQAMDQLQILYDHLARDTKAFRPTRRRLRFCRPATKARLIRGGIGCITTRSTKPFYLTTALPADMPEPRGYWRDLKAICKPTDTAPMIRLVSVKMLPIWGAGRMPGDTLRRLLMRITSGPRPL